MTFKEVGHKLEKTFEFKNYRDAINFVNKVANISETIDHHPDITLFDYRYVKISTTTHSEGGIITKKDTYIAELINKIR